MCAKNKLEKVECEMNLDKTKAEVDKLPKQTDLSPEEIEQLALYDLCHINWESSETMKNISSVTDYAQYLFEGYYSYFYVPETGTFFSVEQDGNYYHGYESIVRRCSKEEILKVVARKLEHAHNESFEEHIIARWENIYRMISEL